MNNMQLHDKYLHQNLSITHITETSEIALLYGSVLNFKIDKYNNVLLCDENRWP